ncbi:mRNA capping enzyme, catalytic domain-containing protein [Halteromyces radiatus]|uniref:mRNA capping enzyme, catalytic domain-containing protein n=1 Tax=Halteromyces radiatus TaxID=101107 RepID=UPI00222010C4|nr:mRNA capping enzyme, catalytic domain-containing protein [Halteromyces radiatus]KAI8086639.1 mRNA capping enzyme, catalytic domain-containing protein [Halteromyces radiatus]
MNHSTVPDIPGIPVPDSDWLKRKIASLLGQRSYRFPGAQPISFGTAELKELEEEDYFVAEKSDGVRCLAFLTRNKTTGGPEVYLFDRKSNFHVVTNMYFPIPQDTEFRKCHDDTIIDGEFVLDKQDDGSLELKFLLFDCLMVGARVLINRDLQKRLGYLKNEIIKPHQKMLIQRPDRKKSQPFTVEFKEQQFTYHLDVVFNQIMPNLRHGSDGLIFTSVSSPYYLGTSKKMIKWKPANENSVDFKVRLQYEQSSTIPGAIDASKKPKIELLVWQGGTDYSYFTDLGITDKEWFDTFGKNPGRFDNRIIECNYDPELQEKYHLTSPWRFMRFRDDKPDGNHQSVVTNVMKSIADGVTKEQLIDHLDVIRQAWKKRNERKY